MKCHRMHLVIQRTPAHALQALDRPIHAALLAIPSICRHALSRCLDEILPQQPVHDGESRRANSYFMVSVREMDMYYPRLQITSISQQNEPGVWYGAVRV